MDSSVLGILFIVGGVIVTGLVYMGFRDSKERDPLQERLAQRGETEKPVESLE
jgi:hypothetical protein